MSKSLFLDANVLYNIIQHRPNAKELKRVIAEYEFIFVSAISELFAYNYCFYTEINTGKKFTDDLEKLLSICHIIQTSSQVTKNAKSILKDKDFEDAVQVATAIHNKCDCILTSDKEMYENYSNLIEIIFVPKS